MNSSNSGKPQYSGDLSGTYKTVSEQDPIKQYVQYPGLLKLLGNVSGKSVLDAGCGNGHLTKKIAELGAHVTAFDISLDQLKLAAQNNYHPRITYFRRDLTKLWMEPSFSKVVAAMVLPYAPNEQTLQVSLWEIYKALLPRGILTAVVINSAFWKAGTHAYNRRFHKNFDNGIKLDWLDSNGKIIDTVEFPALYSKQQYEQAARRAGFCKIRWEVLMPSQEGRKNMPAEYWKSFASDAPFLGLVAEK